MMTQATAERTLHNCRIAVVEDEYLLAEELSEELTTVGAIVLGPVGTIADALNLIEANPDIHGAILDINLRGEMSFTAADLLLSRNIPFVFTTGYDEISIPKRFAAVVRCGKPTSLNKITRAIGRVIQA